MSLVAENRPLWWLEQLPLLEHKAFEWDARTPSSEVSRVVDFRGCGGRRAPLLASTVGLVHDFRRTAARDFRRAGAPEEMNNEIVRLEDPRYV
jgi:hypothetical protein